MLKVHQPIGKYLYEYSFWYSHTKIIDIDSLWLCSSINHSEYMFSPPTRNAFLLSVVPCVLFPLSNILCVYFQRRANLAAGTRWNLLQILPFPRFNSNRNFVPTKFYCVSQKVLVALLPLSIQPTIMLLKTSSSSNYFSEFFIISRRFRIRNHCCVAYTSAELTLSKQQSQLKLMEIV